MIVQALSICNILNLARKLLNADQDLFDILQVAIVLSPETLEFLQEPISGLSCFRNHLSKVLSQLEFILSQCHDIDRDLFILFPEHIVFSHGHTLVHLKDLLG